MQKILTSSRFWIALLFFTYISLFFLKQTNLAASDLGRHIKNGEIILQTGHVFQTNLYSYTNPGFPAPNHHWLFGVIAYVVHQIGGFSALTILGATLYTGAILMVFLFSAKRSNFWSALIATTLCLPLFADRSETRPEAFSMFFFALLFCAFGWMIEQKKIKNSWYLYLSGAVLMALWINIHIFFVLSSVIGIAALIHSLLNKRTALTTSIVGIGISFLLGAFVNPIGLKLVLYPLEIFGNYGYRVSENQTLWFFLQYFTRPIHWYMAGFILVSGVFSWYVAKKNIKQYLYYILLVSIFTLFTVKMIRMENMLAITVLPILSFAFSLFWKEYGKKLQSYLSTSIGLMVGSILGVIVVVLGLATQLFMPITYDLGVGISPEYEQSIYFIRNLKLEGRVFNNFDAGSFLIYTLYPTHQVFIDNRAEAYPADFLQKSYIDAQEDETTWRNLENTYAFSSIIYYRLDQTNWGQEFLIKRIQDPTWIPIYVDSYIIIFVRDTAENQEMISKYRLPANMFSIVETEK